METPLLELLRCPLCHASLEAGEESLTCTGCGRSFAVQDGIPLMLHEDLPGAREKLGELAGWVEKARTEGWYEPDHADDSLLPVLQRARGWGDRVRLPTGHAGPVLARRD